MEPRELKNHKTAAKWLSTPPVFKALKKGRLPKPFHKMGGPRFWTTDLVDVADEYQIVFIWKDGQIATDRAFFGWLFKKTKNSSLYPIFEMHWHPSHKGLHAKVPCRTECDYTNRQLPGAPELDINTAKLYDPQLESDRNLLMHTFYAACGIKIGLRGGLWN